MSAETPGPGSDHGALFTRSFRKSFPIAVRGEGIYLWDADGHRYLDFSGSAAVNFIGHGVREISEAIARQAQAIEFVHSSQFVTSAAEEFAQELLEFAGDDFRGGAVYFTSGGSEAVETALKLARQYQVEIGETQRDQILSRRQSYHGSTLGALAVSGNQRRREIYLPMVRESEHIETPYCYRCTYACDDCASKFAQQLEDAIDRCGSKTRSHAVAFIFEPVSGATLGAALPPQDYLGKVADICAARGVLTIVDEVMTGCGRTGRNFATQHLRLNPGGMTPDIIVTAKGLSSGYLPLGAVIANRKVVDAIRNGKTGAGSFIHGFTYNAHPLAVAAGQAAFSFARSHNLAAAARSDLPGTAASTLASSLKTLLELPVVGDVRGIGLLWGVEFVADKNRRQPFPPAKTFASEVAKACAQRGLLVYPMQGCVDGFAGDHLLIAPPAVIEQQEIVWALEQLREGILSVT